MFDKRKQPNRSGGGTNSGPVEKSPVTNEVDHDINEKEETIQDIYMLIVGYIIILSFGTWFHTYFRKIMPYNIFYSSVFFVVIFPLIIYSYYIFYEIYEVRQHISYEKLLEEVRYEIEKEEKISGIIPVILFGVGIVYSNIQKRANVKTDLLQLSSPYLLFSLLFGTVVPNIISYLIFDNHNLNRLLVASDLDFVSVSMAFGLMIVSLLVPFFTHYKVI